MQRPLTAEEIQEIVDALRAGATLSTPGTRCHSTFGFVDGHWYREDFDEGALDRRNASEHSVRELLADQPRIGAELLRARRWSALRAAFESGDRPGALVALDAWREFGGSPNTALVVTASLAPAKPITDGPTRDALRQMFQSGTLFQLYMDLHGWPEASGTAAHCLDFVDALMGRMDEAIPDSTNLRQRLRDRMAADLE